MPPATADMQRQRLRHLFSSAILELWKKETGSVTSVLIEGTVCITANGGRTTVVQLADRFSGLVTADEADEKTAASGIGRLGGTLRASGGHLYVAAAPATAAVEDLDDSAVGMSIDATAKSTSSWVTATTATRTTTSRDGNNNRTGLSDGNNNNNDDDNDDDDNDDDNGEQQVDVVDNDDDVDEDAMKIDLGDEEVDESAVDLADSRVDRNSESTPIKSLTAGSAQRATDWFYTPRPRRTPKVEVNDEGDDSAIQDMSLRSAPGGPGSISSPCPDRSRTPVMSALDESLTNNRLSNGPTSNGYDTSSSDLILSSPQDYTAQVRNVIRQRILATTRNASGSPNPPSPFHSSPFENICVSFANHVPPVSPYHSTTSPSWTSTPAGLAGAIKQESGGSPAAASIANMAAARRLMSSYGPLGLMSPPPMPVGLSSMPGIALQNLLNIKTSMAALNNAAVLAAAAAVESKPSSASWSSPSSSSAEQTPPTSTAAAPSLGGETSSTGSDGVAAGEQKIYRCDYCFKTFLFKSKYHEHLPVHTSARPFQCHLCTRTYKYKYDLRVHLRTHLGIPTKSTVCPFCAGRFTTNKFLRQHMREAHADQNSQLPAGDSTSTPAGELSTDGGESSSENCCPPAGDTADDSGMDPVDSMTAGSPVKDAMESVTETAADP